MGTRDAVEWLGMAKSCIEGAIVLSRVKTERSAVSRAYYACHAAAHAVIEHLEPGTIGSRSISHGRLPNEFHRAVSLRIPKSGRASMRLAKELGLVYSVRKNADYHPEGVVGSEAVTAAMRSAGRFLEFAKDVLR
jgi:uncharacterized protein (UPF0332 family)